MGLIVVPAESSYDLRFNGSIDIGCAAELKTLLDQALASGRPLNLSLADVTTADVTGMQLLWAAQRAAQKRGLEFTWLDATPEPLLVAMRQLGIENFTSSDSAVPISEVADCQH